MMMQEGTGILTARSRRDGGLREDGSGKNPSTEDFKAVSSGT